MKLYSKQLNSVEELKREKIRLRYERKHTKASDLNPIAEIGMKRKGSDSAFGNFLGMAMSLLGSGSGAETAMKAAPLVFKLLGKRKRKDDGKPRKSLLKKAVTDVLVAYAI